MAGHDNINNTEKKQRENNLEKGKHNLFSCSYRRNRNYKTHFYWSYELNNDLFNCYERAKQTPSVGYMKRLKTYWDDLHPELNYFSAKQLRQQATFVEHKKKVNQCNFNLENVKCNFIPKTGNDQNKNDSTTPCAFIPVQISTHSSQSTLTAAVLSTDREKHDGCSSSGDGDSEEYRQLKFALNEIFKEKIVWILEIPLAERSLTTNINKRPTAEILRAINEIGTEYLRQQDNSPSFWQINACLYALSTTAKQYLGDTKAVNKTNRIHKVPSWIVKIEKKIADLRKTISHVTLLTTCKQANKYTPHQEKVKKKIETMFGDSKKRTLEYKLITLKQELKAVSEKLRYQKRVNERKIINRKFKRNQSTVYRDMRGQSINITKAPSREDMDSFWRKLWSEEKEFNQNAVWLEGIKKEYCPCITPKTYSINGDILETVIQKIQNNKAPGRDLIVGYWYKQLTFCRQYLINLYQQALDGNINVPNWLALAETKLIPKNKDTHMAKNYRPIACQNLMYKLYTACLNLFLQDHCNDNNVITPEQTAGKKGVWGCAEQLLINKTVMSEVRRHKRNLTTVWLDYKKAFDSVPHSWMLEALRLAKVPENIVKAVSNLTSSWATILKLNTGSDCITTDEIQYRSGIFQGDSLSVMLFVLSVNPLSFMLKKSEGYLMGSGDNRSTKHTHCFFVDDLKLYAKNIHNVKKNLDLVTTFSKDIGMEFGQDKCSYMIVNRGKTVSQTNNISINGLTVSPISDEECYRYLGIDENISYNGPCNKERVTKEYYSRIRKIWSSELSAQNKTLAHNMFAVPVLIPTFGLLDWTLDDIRAIDVKTRKILANTGNFHINSDIDRLYLKRKQGGRGLTSIQTAFECRVISLRQHLLTTRCRSAAIDQVCIHESDGIMRVGKELLEEHSLTDNHEHTPREVAQLYRNIISDGKMGAYQQKVMHGYVSRRLQSDTNIDSQSSLSWTNNGYISSHFEGYAFAIQEQEIATKYLIHKRERDAGKPPKCDNRCRLCGVNTEDITHIISSCPKMSSRYYLPMRHDVVAKTMYNAIRRKDSPENKSIKTYSDVESIATHNMTEYWWNVPVKTSIKCKHNRPDIMIWDRKEKLCTVVEISCPADVNITLKTKEKEDIYAELMRNLQLLHPDYKFRFIPVIIGALGYVTNCLSTNLEKLGFSKPERTWLIRKLQIQAINGTVKICKTFQKFSM